MSHPRKNILDMAIVGKVISAIGTIMTIIPKLAGVINAAKGVFAAFNAVCAANPYVLIIAAIVALVAALIYLWNNCEEFRQFWIDLWESIKEIAVAIGGFERVLYGGVGSDKDHGCYGMECDKILLHHDLERD